MIANPLFSKTVQARSRSNQRLLRPICALLLATVVGPSTTWAAERTDIEQALTSLRSVLTTLPLDVRETAVAQRLWQVHDAVMSGLASSAPSERPISPVVYQALEQLARDTALLRAQVSDRDAIRQLNRAYARIERTLGRFDGDQSSDRQSATTAWDFAANVARTAWPWPIIVICCLAYLFGAPGAPARLSAIVRPIRTFKWAGFEVVLTEETSKELTGTAEEAFGRYRDQTKKEYNRLAKAYKIREKLQAVLQNAMAPERGPLSGVPHLRATIYVPDALFDETLYQLLDYYPKGDHRGRTKSSRFGIIGKVWRSEQSEVEGNVPRDPQRLIREWGMTSEEALAAGQGRPSFACVLLRGDDDTAVGMVYLDSTDDTAFGKAEHTRTIIDSVVDASRAHHLTASLAKLTHDLAQRSPRLRLYDL